MPLFVIESLLNMTRVYGKELPPGVIRILNKSVHGLVAPMVEVERIKANPVAFAYITHLRLLLIVYLGALPLALVESLGWSTIPVFMVISYALMSLEIIAVMIENPFGVETSDLRIDEFNQEILYTVAGMWRRFERSLESEEERAAKEYNGDLFAKDHRLLPQYKVW